MDIKSSSKGENENWEAEEEDDFIVDKEIVKLKDDFRQTLTSHIHMCTNKRVA